MIKHNKCKLLDIELPLNKVCPASKDFNERFVCYENCGFSPLRQKKVEIKMKKIVQKKLFE